jgi:DNA-binding protein HU-beta
MNNKEFTEALSQNLSTSLNDIQDGISALTNAIIDIVDDDTILAIKGFGTFEVRKRLERIAVNPSNQQKMLVPPKLSIVFRPSPTLKEKATKNIQNQ